MRVLLTDDSTDALSNSFLLDDDSRYSASLNVLNFAQPLNNILHCRWTSNIIRMTELSHFILSPNNIISFFMQYSLFCGWYIEVHEPDRFVRNWTSSFYSSEFSFQLFIAACRVIFLIGKVPMFLCLANYFRQILVHWSTSIGCICSFIVVFLAQKVSIKSTQGEFVVTTHLLFLPQENMILFSLGLLFAFWQ